MVNYAFEASLLPPEMIKALLTELEKSGSQSVNTLLTATGAATPAGVRSLMWLWKFDLVQIAPALAAQ